MCLFNNLIDWEIEFVNKFSYKSSPLFVFSLKVAVLKYRVKVNFFMYTQTGCS